MKPKLFDLARRRAGQSALAILVTIGVMTACWVGYVNHTLNFHVVEAGQFYRAGRVPPAMLEPLIRQYGIRSVLNLEGARPEKAWYQAEVAELDRLRISHYDVRLSATRILQPEQVAGLLDIIRTAPKPLLVHCRSGADRSGLAAALYLAKLRHRDKDEAYDQLSMAYGHFPYLWSATKEMDDTYWASVDPTRELE